MAVISALGTADTLYFSHVFNPDVYDGYIERVDLDGGSVETLVITGSGVRGIALDSVYDKLYWADTSELVIRRSDLDGTNREDVITSGLEWPRDLEVEPSGGKVYYGDQLTFLLKRANLDGSAEQTLRSTAFHAALAIDHVNGKIYWSTSDSDVKGKILRCNLDGSGLQTVVNSNAPQFKPAGVAVDPVGGKVYWTDYVVDFVRRSNLDGTDIEDLYVVGSNRNPRPIWLDLAHGKVYWGQDVIDFGPPYEGKIMRMDLDGANPEDVVTGLGNVVDLAILPSQTGCEPCDVNCDGSVNGFDIQPLIDALSPDAPPACSPCAGDASGDGSVNAFDIQPFMECLAG